jgi:hypothetical protein
LGRTSIGVAVGCTPNFHAELAGEGIEYSWGNAKQLCRLKPVALKKGPDRVQPYYVRRRYRVFFAKFLAPFEPCAKKPVPE